MLNGPGMSTRGSSPREEGGDEIAISEHEAKCYLRLLLSFGSICWCREPVGKWSNVRRPRNCRCESIFIWNTLKELYTLLKLTETQWVWTIHQNWSRFMKHSFRLCRNVDCRRRFLKVVLHRWYRLPLSRLLDMVELQAAPSLGPSRPVFHFEHIESRC